ncbi:16821_t:CDS:2, partial [Cetraspora pellucida]
GNREIDEFLQSTAPTNTKQKFMASMVQASTESAMMETWNCF